MTLSDLTSDAVITPVKSASASLSTRSPIHRMRTTLETRGVLASRAHKNISANYCVPNMFSKFWQWEDGYIRYESPLRMEPKIMAANLSGE